MGDVSIRHVFYVSPIVESAGNHDIRLLSSQQCAGHERCECAAGPSGPVLLSGPTAKASFVVGHQPAAALHTSHPTAPRDPGGLDTGSGF